MKALILMSLLSAGCAVGVGPLKNVAFEHEELNANIIVQLKNNMSGASEKEKLSYQNSVINEIANITSDYKIEERYSSITNGFQIKVNQAHVAKIRELDNVRDVNYDHCIYVEKTADTVREIDEDGNVVMTSEMSNVSAHTMDTPAETNEGEGVVIAIFDTGALLNATITDSEGSTHTGVTHNTFTDLDASVTKKLTQENIQEKINGATTFYGRKDAEHSTYWNSKVPFYYDYGGDTTSNSSVGEEDYDVYEPISGHGTHVASIAAGNDPYYKGIAPKAQLLVMKVFTEYYPTKADAAEGAVASVGAYESVMLKAFNDAAVLGADIVNLSLGNSLIDTEDNSILNNLVKELTNDGMLINFSQGNEGNGVFDGTPLGVYTNDIIETGFMGSHANNSASMSIAAGQADEEFYANAFIVDGSTIAYSDQVTNYNDVTYTQERYLTDLLATHPNGKVDWVKVPGFGDESSYSKVNCSGKIAVCDRGGEISFLTKIQGAEADGAVACAVIDNDPADSDFSFRMSLEVDSSTGAVYTPKIPVILILYRDKGVFDNAKSHTAEIVQNKSCLNPNARMITSFTTNGASHDFQLKPEITAPGQNILGAVGIDGSTATNLYQYWDGTSMAAPNYCGALAVLLSENTDDLEYRASLNDRLMSTANIMKDRYRVNHESVRLQGAGMASLGRALSTDAFLDGSSVDGELTNKAKIELKNNEDIKQGDVKLSFTAVNETESDLVYTATTYVYRPELVTMNEELYPSLAGGKFQATYDHLIGKVSQEVTLAPGQHVINLDTYTLSDYDKEYINYYFESGCYIEGYVVLTAKNQPTLSIPYLGFYGDTANAMPVEPFPFEKDPYTIYPSQLLNEVAKNTKTNVDFGSNWVYGNFDNLGSVAIEPWLLGDKKLEQLVDQNTKTLTPIGKNPFNGVINRNKLVVGNNGYANTMIISQFVTRSVKTNTITLTNNATQETILTDHMYDSLYGATYDEVDTDLEVAWPLIKSFPSLDYWSSGIFAHRAYTIIPLFEFTEIDDGNGNITYESGDLFPDGEYTINFNYETVDGQIFEKEYTLIIESSIPTIDHAVKVTYGGADYMRYFFTSKSMSYVSLSGGQKAKVYIDSQGRYYYDVPLTSSNENISLQSCTYTNSKATFITNTKDSNAFTLSANNLLTSYKLKNTITDVDENTKDVTLKVTKKTGATVNDLTGPFTITFNVCDAFLNGTVAVYVQDGEQQWQQVEVNRSYGTIRFTSNSLTFRMVFTAGVNPDPLPDEVELPCVEEDPVDPLPPEPFPEKEDKSSSTGCGGSIISSSVLLFALSLTGVVLVKKRKNQ